MPMRPHDRHRRATIHDVAAAAGVSRGTVSRVLNAGRYVSPEAKIAVEEAILRVGYVPNAAARNLVKQRSQAVAFLVHEPHALFMEDPNIGAILLGANTALSRADYQMVCVVIDSDRDLDRVERYLGGGFVDGVIMVSARSSDPVIETIEQLGIPAAFVGHPPALNRSPFVGINNRAAAAAITRKLRGTGRTRIGMIAAALDRDSGADRLAGFQDALGEEFDPTLVVDVEHYAYSAGVDGALELLSRDATVDGIFAASDAVAAGVMDALQRSGRHVPNDVGVVGFDDSSWASRTNPHLSTVRQPAGALGEQAAELVLAQLAGAATPNSGILLPTPIIWRDSA